MANELQRHDSGGFLKSLDRFIQDSGLQDVKTRMDSRKGTATITGSRDG